MPEAMVATRASEATGSGKTQHVDVAVVGAGFAGLYLLHRLRKAGFTAVGLEEADDVGGTWYWNRYPGARCDIQTTDYSYTFDPELEKAWQWSEKYATQPEILRYLGFVADRYDLRRDIRFGTRVTAATWDEATHRWLLTTSTGAPVSCRYLHHGERLPLRAQAAGDRRGRRFQGRDLLHRPLAARGRQARRQARRDHRHGLVGHPGDPADRRAGGPSDGVPAHAELRLPGAQRPAPTDRVALLEKDRADYREQARWSLAGVPLPRTTEFSWQLSEAERRQRFETALAAGDLIVMLTQLWADQGVDVEGNALAADLIREKIRSIVKDPETAAALTPRDHPFGVQTALPRDQLLRDLQPAQRHPGQSAAGADQVDHPDRHQTDRRTFDVDVIVFATGFDAMTGAIMAVHPITGRGGKSLSDVWAHGPQTYLGLTVAGFPNLFMITGPGSPSVLSNMAGVDRAARRLGGRPPDRDARGGLHRPSRRPRRRRPAGRATWPTARRSRCIAWPTPGTRAPTCRARRRA